MSLPCDQNKITCTYFDNIAISKKNRTCYRIKLCEFANPELKEMKYKSVNPDSNLHLKISKELSTDNVKYNTFA